MLMYSSCTCFAQFLKIGNILLLSIQIFKLDYKDELSSHFKI